MKAPADTPAKPRVAVLWMALSGYFDASLRALSRAGAEIFISDRQARSQAPFAEDQFGWLVHRYTFRRDPDLEELTRRLAEFRPDVLFICSWHIPAYRAIARLYRGRAPRVLCMDNLWRGTLRQRLGTFGSRWYVQPLFDLAWVSGDASADFAERLGFSRDRILFGLNSCDDAAFATARPLRPSVPPAIFLYVGRLSPEKGVAQLAAAYRQYRATAPDPWPLVVCGAGPEVSQVQGIPGVRLTGFLQPAAMPATMASSGCLVVPSLRETWSITIHEATTVGIPVICTSGCGAAAHLVLPGENGMVVAPGNAGQLARAMADFTGLSPERRREMGDRSAILSAQYTAGRWAKTALSVIPATT